MQSRRRILMGEQIALGYRHALMDGADALPASPLTLVLMDMEEHTFSTSLVRTGE
ncbi:TPA: hypothetical protein G8O00_000985 [Salmonella enterica]|uniref:Uncharacterized protein n=1 Tax=Salmonella enterica TaxID=28901 RepID=A0A747SUI3_SALER|nr:hypothetical protein [Salmonella enterica]